MYTCKVSTKLSHSSVQRLSTLPRSKGQVLIGRSSKTTQNHSTFKVLRKKQNLRFVCRASDSKESSAPIELGAKQKEIDWPLLWGQFVQLATPYWNAPDVQSGARWRLAGVFALTLATTGVSVGFNFLGRDFFNAIAEKNVDDFQRLLVMYTGAIACGIPVFVMRDFFRQRLSLRWRDWMTRDYLDKYFDERAFYRIQAGSLIDNPDQRINDDVTQFTATALGFTLIAFNSLIDLASFSGILYSIYPPLFGVLIVYALGGTYLTVQIGQRQVGLNFEQETREANFRFSLMRIRENAESIAFYGGEKNEQRVLLKRFKSALDNFSDLLVATRNLDFFTSGYKYLISFLPAAVIAPLYFKGEIEFGVINQSASAFNHILNDISLVVYQFESVAGFSAVIERLTQFSEVIDVKAVDKKEEGEKDESDKEPVAISDKETLQVIDLAEIRPLVEPSTNGNGPPGQTLLDIRGLTLETPNRSTTLVKDLSLAVTAGRPLLIMGPSGSGKTSLMRAVAGLWENGRGSVLRVSRVAESGGSGFSLETALDLTQDQNQEEGEAEVFNSTPLPEALFFVPQRPYMVLGTLREQLLYPTWTECMTDGALGMNEEGNEEAEAKREELCIPIPDDEELIEVLQRVRLTTVLEYKDGLDTQLDWGSVLSLGEQQRLAFARLLLTSPQLALLDESTSALDIDNEAHLYSQMIEAGITFVSVGHRPSLVDFHKDVLELNVKTNDGGNNWKVRSTDAVAEAL